MKISVVVCTYSMDHADLFEDAVESVLAQEYEPLEAVLIIDGNREVFEYVTERFGDCDQVRLYNNDRNRGISYSRTRGAELATGDVVAFIVPAGKGLLVSAPATATPPVAVWLQDEVADLGRVAVPSLQYRAVEDDAGADATRQRQVDDVLGLATAVLGDPPGDSVVEHCHRRLRRELVGDTAFIRACPEIGVAAAKTFASQVATMTMLAVVIGRERGALAAADAEEFRELTGAV